MKIIAIVEHAEKMPSYVGDTTWVEEGWRIVFDESLFSYFDFVLEPRGRQQSYFSVLRAWLDENATSDWCILSTKSIAFKDHSDAMLCYVKFSAGVF